MILQAESQGDVTEKRACRREERANSAEERACRVEESANIVMGRFKGVIALALPDSIYFVLLPTFNGHTRVRLGLVKGLSHPG